MNGHGAVICPCRKTIDFKYPETIAMCYFCKRLFRGYWADEELANGEKFKLLVGARIQNWGFYK